jgi:hypothetical protein
VSATACFYIHRGREFSLFLNWVEFRKELPEWLNGLVCKERWTAPCVCVVWLTDNRARLWLTHTSIWQAQTPGKQRSSWGKINWKISKQKSWFVFCLSVCLSVSRAAPPGTQWISCSLDAILGHRSYELKPTARPGGEMLSLLSLLKLPFPLLYWSFLNPSGLLFFLTSLWITNENQSFGGVCVESY